jgi:hypothetical protein
MIVAASDVSVCSAGMRWPGSIMAEPFEPLEPFEPFEPLAPFEPLEPLGWLFALQQVRDLTGGLECPVVTACRTVGIDLQRRGEQTIESAFESRALPGVAGEEVTHRETVSQLRAVALHSLLLLAGRFVEVIGTEAVDHVMNS